MHSSCAWIQSHVRWCELHKSDGVKWYRNTCCQRPRQQKDRSLAGHYNLPQTLTTTHCDVTRWRTILKHTRSVLEAVTVLCHTPGYQHAGSHEFLHAAQTNDLAAAAQCSGSRHHCDKCAQGVCCNTFTHSRGSRGAFTSAGTPCRSQAVAGALGTAAAVLLRPSCCCCSLPLHCLAAALPLHVCHR